MPRQKLDREWFSPTELAELTGKTADWVRNEIRAGRLSAVDFAKPGSLKSRFRVHKDDWEAFLNRRRTHPPSPAPRRAPQRRGRWF